MLVKKHCSQRSSTTFKLLRRLFQENHVSDVISKIKVVLIQNVVTINNLANEVSQYMRGIRFGDAIVQSMVFNLHWENMPKEIELRRLT